MTSPLTSSLDDELLADSETPISIDLMQRISDSTNTLLALRQRIVVAEAALANLKKEEEALAHTVLPSLLDEAHVLDMTLDNNLRLTRREEIHANIAKNNLPEAAIWLEVHGYGAIVKSSIEVKFERGEKALAAAARAALQNAKILYSESYSIHPQTLKAFVREALEREAQQQGPTLPSSISYYVRPTVDIKLPKEHV